jgi:hypothetical protein
VLLTAHAPSDALRLPPWCSLHGSDDVPVFPLDAQGETTGEIWRELEAACPSNKPHRVASNIAKLLTLLPEPTCQGSFYHFFSDLTLSTVIIQCALVLHGALDPRALQQTGGFDV